MAQLEATKLIPLPMQAARILVVQTAVVQRLVIAQSESLLNSPQMTKRSRSRMDSLLLVLEFLYEDISHYQLGRAKFSSHLCLDITT